MAPRFLAAALVLAAIACSLYAGINVFGYRPMANPTAQYTLALEGPEAGVCGNGTCETGENETNCPNDCDFIFSFWPIYVTSGYTNFSALDDMMATGMTHAGVYIRPNSNEEQDLALIKSKYKIMQEISSGHYDWGGPTELTQGDDDSKFLTADCLDSPEERARCENWNSPTIAIDPSYKGTLWDITLDNTENVASRAKPDAVFFDIEIWQNPVSIDYYFTVEDQGKDCDCKVVEEGIGHDAYNREWMQRGLDLKNIIKQINPKARVYFYHEIPYLGKGWKQDYKGDYSVHPASGDPGYIQYPSGDSANPSLYFLPNLELFEKNMDDINIKDSIATLSFSYYSGYSNYLPNAEIVFDPSVSREAGRMLRQAGAKGFYIWPNAEDQRSWFGYGQESYDRWLQHASEMIKGFKEGLTYVEKNKIRNPDFEAFKPKADKTGSFVTGPYIAPTLGNVRFIPVFWNWSDTNSSYDDNAIYANLTTDKESGTYSWRHTRLGDIGNRAILSQNFAINSSEIGDYDFSAWSKASISSDKGSVKFYLVDSSQNEQEIGENYFKDSWNKIENKISISPGDYRIKIIIDDKTGQKVDIFLDNVSLTKAPIIIECGNTICDAGETFETCPADCQECVGNEKLVGYYIPQWKRGEITMLVLMQKIRQRNAGTGCPQNQSQ